MARLLVVDDDPVIARVVGTTLEGAGHQVVEVSDPKEALERLLRKGADLVISDIQMPVLNGHMLFHQVRRLYPNVGFIAMSGYYRAEDFPDLKFDAFLFKPFSCAELLDATLHVLSVMPPVSAKGTTIKNYTKMAG